MWEFRRLVALLLAAAVAALCFGAVPALAAGPAQPERIFVIAYDNTHPEDLAAMPHLQAFLQQAATVPWHTVLVSHTAPDYVALASGYYPRRSGVPDNSYQAAGRFTGWRFWESPAGDGQPAVQAPPFWRVFNQAGRDVGVIGWGDAVLENYDDVKEQMKAHPEYFPAGTGRDSEDYKGYAAFYRDGRRAYGAPSLPWLDGVAGPLRQWSTLTTPLALKATLAMQQHGLTVTFTYIESVHEGRDRGKFGDRLREADAAWAEFFAGLQAMGVTARNSLFVITADEGDHYNAGGTLGSSLSAWLADNPGHNLPEGSVLSTGSGNSLLYLPKAGELQPLAAALAAVPGWRYVLVPEVMALVQAAEPGSPRAPALIVLPEPDRTFTNGPGRKAWEPISGYYWNHGTVDPSINEVFFFAAGPGIAPGERAVWADHTDLLPTMAYALGQPLPPGDGRPIFELWQPQPDPGLTGAADLFKQVSSPLGSLGMKGLTLSNDLLRLTAINPAEAASLRQELGALVADRDKVAAALRQRIGAILAGREAAASSAVAADVRQADALFERLDRLAQQAKAALAAGPGAAGSAGPAGAPAGAPGTAAGAQAAPGQPERPPWAYGAAVAAMAAGLWWMRRRHRRQ